MPAKTEEIFRVTDEIEEIMGAQEFPPGAIREISAAVKEVLTNIVRHGYKGRPGEIGIRCTATPAKVTVEIADSAPAYNPLQAPGPDTTGGIGIAFIRQAADIVTYQHKNHRNILTLVRVKRNGEPDPASGLKKE
nr:ATP-binding protein [Methanoregula boonei]